MAREDQQGATLQDGYQDTDFAYTGPGTLAGRLARMFWHPIYPSADLAPGWAKPIKIMGEEFTLYRGESGVAHLVGSRCAHRGTQLSTGWVEDDCLRCRYHGWKFDAAGQCIAQPLEKTPFADKVRIKSYPTYEYIGLIFAYLGEGKPPPPPSYPALEAEGVREVEFVTRACNWVANLENDPGHGAFTHHPRSLPRGEFYAPDVTVEEANCGIRRVASYPNGEAHVSFRGFPNTGYQKSPPRDPQAGWRTTFIAWVPVDDGNHLQVRSDLVQVTGEAARRYQEARRSWYATGGKDFDPDLSQAVLEGKFRLDDLKQERSDINLTNVEDDVTQIGQGAIRRFDDEHLGAADAYVFLVRRIWQRELRALAQGRPLKRWTTPSDEITDGADQGREASGLVYQR